MFLTQLIIILCTLEIDNAKKELKEEQEKNANLQSEAMHHAITKAELKRTSELAAEQMKIAEKFKIEAEAARSDQRILAKSLADLAQKTKEAETAKAKIEHSAEANKTLLDNLKADYNKLLHRSNAV